MGHSEFDPGAKRRPWNAGRKLGAKRALKPQQVWAVLAAATGRPFPAFAGGLVERCQRVHHQAREAVDRRFGRPAARRIASAKSRLSSNQRKRSVTGPVRRPERRARAASSAMAADRPAWRRDGIQLGSGLHLPQHPFSRLQSTSSSPASKLKSGRRENSADETGRPL